MKLEQADNNIDKQEDRRKYFRIDDVAILYHRVIEDEEMVNDAVQQLHIDRLTLKAKFDSMSRELKPIKNKISANSPSIAEYLQVLDTKINLMSEVLMDDELTAMDVSPQKVNISAGGMSFHSPQILSKGSVLEMKMVLLPDNTGIYSHADVVSCKPNPGSDNPDEAFVVSVKFIRMNDEIRDAISRHVLMTERASLMRKNRE